MLPRLLTSATNTFLNLWISQFSMKENTYVYLYHFYACINNYYFRKWVNYKNEIVDSALSFLNSMIYQNKIRKSRDQHRKKLFFFNMWNEAWHYSSKIPCKKRTTVAIPFEGKVKVNFVKISVANIYWFSWNERGTWNYFRTFVFSSIPDCAVKVNHNRNCPPVPHFCVKSIICIFDCCTCVYFITT